MIAAWITARFAGLGVKLAAAGAILLAILLAVLKLISVGKQEAQSAELAKEAAAAKQKKELDDEISRLSPADLDARLAKWVPDEPKR